MATFSMFIATWEGIDMGVVEQGFLTISPRKPLQYKNIEFSKVFGDKFTF